VEPAHDKQALQFAIKYILSLELHQLRSIAQVAMHADNALVIGI